MYKNENIYPWIKPYESAKYRCTNIKAANYKKYGAKGIKFLMSLEDFKYLWLRDNAYEMDKPSIDRIDSKGNYELSNCRFIEHKINSAQGGKNGIGGSKKSIKHSEGAKKRWEMKRKSLLPVQ